MRQVPLYDGDENLGLAPYTANLDSWDGMRWRHLCAGRHLGVGRLDDGRCYACYSSGFPDGIVRRKLGDGTCEILFRCSDDFCPPALAEIVSVKKQRSWFSNTRKCCMRRPSRKRPRRWMLLPVYTLLQLDYNDWIINGSRLLILRSLDLAPILQGPAGPLFGKPRGHARLSA